MLCNHLAMTTKPLTTLSPIYIGSLSLAINKASWSKKAPNGALFQENSTGIRAECFRCGGNWIVTKAWLGKWVILKTLTLAPNVMYLFIITNFMYFLVNLAQWALYHWFCMFFIYVFDVRINKKTNELKFPNFATFASFSLFQWLEDSKNQNRSNPNSRFDWQRAHVLGKDSKKVQISMSKTSLEGCHS